MRTVQENKIGVEIEFLIQKNGEFVFPKTSTDEFPLLGEIRSIASTDITEVFGDLMGKIEKIKSSLDEEEILIFPEEYVTIPYSLYRKSMEKMRGHDKSEIFREIKNVYDHDVGQHSDFNTDKNQIIQSVNISAGVHIHFSSAYITIDEKEQYSKFNKLNNLSEDVDRILSFVGELYLKENQKYTNRERNSIITLPILKEVIKEMDNLYENYKPTELTKWRYPGFYKTKLHGFEYRSLPSSPKVISDLYSILLYAKNTLDTLTEII